MMIRDSYARSPAQATVSLALRPYLWLPPSLPLLPIGLADALCGGEDQLLVASLNEGDLASRPRHLASPPSTTLLPQLLLSLFKFKSLKLFFSWG